MWFTTVPDDTDSHEFSPSEITAMRYAYRQLLVDNPEWFSDPQAKENLARSVIKSLELIRSAPAKDIAEVLTLIMAEDA